MSNQELKQYAKKKNVRLWQVAKCFGINDGNFSRKLRNKFTPEEADRFRQYVDQIAQEESI